jgi:hypothetical protein
VILRILHKLPFELARSIAQTLKIVHSTVLHHLHKCHEFPFFHLRWIPYLMTEDRMHKRKDVAQQIIPDPEAAARTELKRFVTKISHDFFYRNPP